MKVRYTHDEFYLMCLLNIDIDDRRGKVIDVSEEDFKAYTDAWDALSTLSKLEEKIRNGIKNEIS